MPETLHEVLKSTGLPGCHPELDSRLAEQGVASALRDRAAQLVSEMEAEGKPWLWKEPYLSVTLSFWENVPGLSPGKGISRGGQARPPSLSLAFLPFRILNLLCLLFQLRRT